jgi:beta-N-acetylhexosaminidase
MTSHITLPKVASDNLPTSLSYDLVTGKLRNELGYDGVVITDSMAMGAITNKYSTGAAAVTAIKAGVDLILCTPNLAEAHTAILNAVKNGEISIERIDESVARIDALFEKYSIS